MLLHYIKVMFQEHVIFLSSSFVNTCQFLIPVFPVFTQFSTSFCLSFLLWTLVNSFPNLVFSFAGF